MGQDINSYKMEEMLADLKEKMAESRKLPPDEQRKFWEELQDREARKYPSNPLGPCKDKDTTCRFITEAFGHLTNLGYGDIQELCDLTVFHEALERMDINECQVEFGMDAKKDLSSFINICLFDEMQKVVHERLLNDNFDEEEVEETYIYCGESADFCSPFDFAWMGPLSEEAQKRFDEKE